MKIALIENQNFLKTPLTTWKNVKTIGSEIDIQKQSTIPFYQIQIYTYVSALRVSFDMVTIWINKWA